MRNQLLDRVVIVTGASSGIGKALVFAFANQKAKIVLAARNLPALEEIASVLASQAVEALAVRVDISVEEDCLQLIEKTMARFGRIDILVNNAGISMRALFSDVHLDVIRKLMDVNFWGTVYCTKYALNHLLAVQGSVVGVISVAGHVGLPGRTGYSASKFAVRGFLEALRTENQNTGLHVLIVAPGFTSSNIRKTALVSDGSSQGESPRDESTMMSAEEVARKILQAVIRKKKNIVLSLVEGKITVLLHKFVPGLVARLAYRHMASEPDSPFK